MINLNANVSSVMPVGNSGAAGANNGKTAGAGSGFADAVKAVGKQISKVDGLQQTADMSIQDLLSGKNEDLTSVVSAAAKADMSFKLLVGVRNKLIEAYKQTMNMPL
jgi:flagellar hook-basal body complex protein FliE